MIYEGLYAIKQRNPSKPFFRSEQSGSAVLGIIERAWKVGISKYCIGKVMSWVEELVYFLI